MVCSVSLAEHGSIIVGPLLETCKSVWRTVNAMDSTGITSMVSTCATVTLMDAF